MKLFSIIVPIYNVEDYLEECVESIVNQTFKDYEIILVDDGSQDKSGLLADELAKEYPNIMVIHKENGGLSSSRNVGIQNAKGEYILFVDSDDKLSDADALQRISDNIDNKEIVLLGFEKWYSDNSVAAIVKDVKFDGSNIDEVIFNLIKGNNFVSSACNKCISRDFLIKNNLFFKEGILSEDVEWSVRLLVCMKSVGSVDGSYYMYRQTREGSISTVFSSKHAYDLTESIEDCIGYIEKVNLVKKEAILNFIAYQYMVLIAYYNEIKDSKLKRRIKSLDYLLNYDSIKKVKIINLLRNIFGFTVTTLLMNKYVRNRK